MSTMCNITRCVFYSVFVEIVTVLLIIHTFILVNSEQKHSEIGKEYLIHVTLPEYVPVLTLNAERFSLEYVEQVSPNVHIFMDIAQSDNTSDQPLISTSVQDFWDFSRDFILEVQPYTDISLKQFQYSFVSKPSKFEHIIRKRALHNQKCSSYYGMDVEEAWVLNYTGAGVNVGILDVGVETEHPDLQTNINKKLGHNFVYRDHRHDFRPFYDENYRSEVATRMDHGTNIAGLIAAIKGNDLCCRGVAFDASIVPLVVFKYKWYEPYFTERYIPVALVHKNQEIHIYSNSYNNKQPFEKPTIAMVDSLVTGTQKGRGGLGSRFVFSLGDNADDIHDGNMDPFANSIYTITVGSVGRGGVVPKYAIPCACIIASTLGDGKTMEADSFWTTSGRRSCSNTFKGSSAAAGIGAAIIALGLHDRLSWRDIQYLLISTSSLESLTPSLPSTKNAVGLTYNPHFGFGLMNATAFVLAAKTWTPVSEQMSTVLELNWKLRLKSKPKSGGPQIHLVNGEVVKCGPTAHCLRFVEHVVARIQYTATRDRLISIHLCSPSKTCSRLLSDASGRRKNPKAKKVVRRTWDFESVQFWGESPVGNWSIVMQQYNTRTNKSYTHFAVKHVTLYIYGTSSNAFKHNSHLQPRASPTEDDIQADDDSSFLDTLRSPEERDKVYTAVIEGDTDSILGGTDETGQKGHMNYFLALTVLIVPICLLVYESIKWFRLRRKQL